MGSLWVVGSANLDLVFMCRRFPATGETVLGGVFSSFPGGKGANQAVAIAKLGGQVSFVGCVGRDPFGQTLLDSLQRAGVDGAGVRVVDEVPTGTAGILVDGEGQNKIVVASGANMSLTPEYVRQCLTDAPGSAVLTQLEIPPEAVEAASEFGRFYLNPAPARDLPESLYARIYAITPNQSEAEALTAVDTSSPQGCRSAASHLLDKGIQNVVITLGDRGCYWTDGASEKTVPAPSVKAVDTVGAGDAFSGALVHYLESGREWENALHLANHVAALAVTKAGAQAAMPTAGELQQFAGHLL